MGALARKGCVIWVVHGAVLGLRASLFSLSLRIKRGMVSVTVLLVILWYVCDCFRPVIFNDHEVTNFLDENTLYCCGFSPFMHLGPVGPGFCVSVLTVRASKIPWAIQDIRRV